MPLLLCWYHGPFRWFFNTRFLKSIKKEMDRSNKELQILYKRITANTSALWQHAAHTTNQLLLAAKQKPYKNTIWPAVGVTFVVIWTCMERVMEQGGRVSCDVNQFPGRWKVPDCTYNQPGTGNSLYSQVVLRCSPASFLLVCIRFHDCILLHCPSHLAVLSLKRTRYHR